MIKKIFLILHDGRDYMNISENSKVPKKPKIVVIGAGYGGLMAIKQLQKGLRDTQEEIILISLHNYHYITTRLHEVAAGTSGPEHVCIPVSSVIDTQRVRFVEGRVSGLNMDTQQVEIEGMDPISYDKLVIALGSSPETFGIKGLTENAFLIRDVKSASSLCAHMEEMFAGYTKDPQEDLITIVIGGAGFTGIEYIGELVDRLPSLCEKYDVPKEKVRLINIEAAPHVLPTFDEDLREHAKRYLEEKGVEIRTETIIEECTPDGVILKSGEKIASKTVVWTGGVRGNALIEKFGFKTERGFVKVDAFLRAPGQDQVFIIGDSSMVLDDQGKPYPATAQIATQQGWNVGRNIVRGLRGLPMRPFSYSEKGTVASIGRQEAVGVLGGGKVKWVGKKASVMKKIIDLRWLFLLGGVPLVFKMGKGIDNKNVNDKNAG